MTHFAIASLQLATTSGNNLDLITDEITSSISRFPWINMIVLSELCSFGHEKKNAEQLPGVAEQRYCQIAREHNIWIVCHDSVFDNFKSRKCL